MAVRDLMAVFDGSSRDAEVLSVAGELARRDDAHLLGFCPLDVLYPANLGLVVGGYPDALVLQAEIERLQAQSFQRASTIEAVFNEQLRRDGTAGDWQLGSGPANDEAVRRARAVDLVVLSQPDPGHEARVALRTMVEDVLLRSGRPALFLPFAGHAREIGTNVVVAWNGSREGTRALHDALPLLRPDASVTVLTIARPDGDMEGDLRGADIAEHLARHRFRTTVARSVTDRDLSEADVLLGYVADTGANLLVMGGYGHSRTRQMIFGGVTRALLEHMTLPVLMSH